MPPYKEQGIVLRSIKLGEADKIVTIMTQGSGKVRAVAKGIRKTTSRFGARLEPFTHASLMFYRGRGPLDTITQAEIIAPHMALRGDLALFAAGETMLEAVDKVAEQGGAVCARCAERGAGPVSEAALRYLGELASTDLSEAGAVDEPDPRVRRETRGLLYGFAEYYLERRMKSIPMLVRTAR